MESSYQKFTKEVVVLGIMTALVSIGDVILLPLLTKTLGAQEYGIWSQVQATLGFIVPLAGLGLPFAMVRFLAAEKDRKTIREGFYSIVTVVLLGNLVISLVLILFPGLIADYFFDGMQQAVRLTGLLVLAFALNGVFLAFFRTFRRVKTYALLNVARAFTEIGVIAALVLNGHGVLSAILALLAIRTILFLVALFLVGSKIGVKRPAFSGMKTYLRFSLPSLAGNMTSWVVALSDRYVIAFFLGTAWVGVYSAGYVIAHASVLFANVLAFALPAALSQLYDQGRIEEVKVHLRYSLKYNLAISIPFVFGALALSEPVLRMFSTADIASEGHWVIPVVALGFLFTSFGVVPWHILILVKKTKIIAAAWAVAALVNLSLNIVVVPHMGIMGAAMTTAFAYLLLLLVQSYYAAREIRFSIDWRFIIKSLIASGVMSLLIWRIAPEGNIAIILTVLIGVVVYAAILLLLRGFSRGELEFFRGLFRIG